MSLEQLFDYLSSNFFISLALGLAAAALGGEFFVRAVVEGARLMRVPPALAGLTLAAFATSSPELSVGVSSGLQNAGALSLGDVLGSNIANIGLVVGIALLLGPLKVDTSLVTRDTSIALAAPLLTAILCLDDILSRWDALLLLVIFILWLLLAGREAIQKRQHIQHGKVSLRELANFIFMGALGLFLLVMAGKFIVVGAKDLAQTFHMPEFIVGGTIVALGTSVPELATTIISRIKHIDDIGLATVLGSNIFNNLFIVGTVGIINPISIDFHRTSFACIAGMIVLLMAIPWKSNIIGKLRGACLVAIYACYLGLSYFWWG